MTRFKTGPITSARVHFLIETTKCAWYACTRDAYSDRKTNYRYGGNNLRDYTDHSLLSLDLCDYPTDIVIFLQYRHIVMICRIGETSDQIQLSFIHLLVIEILYRRLYQSSAPKDRGQ